MLLLVFLKLAQRYLEKEMLIVVESIRISDLDALENSFVPNSIVVRCIMSLKSCCTIMGSKSLSLRDI